MSRPRRLLAALLWCSLLLVSGRSAQTLQVINRDDHATTLTAAQIAERAERHGQRQ